MCGIGGFMASPQHEVSEDALKKFAHSLTHRGPDDLGIVVQDSVGLVHTRLSIIDVNHGHQPITDMNNTSLIVNGEIYNYVELRDSFSSYPFKTASDVEVILPLYQLYGLEFAKYLRGMFGVALYDSKKKNLVLSRDPFGIKPLYYAETSKGFAFASEPQAIIATGLVHPDTDEIPRAETLQLRYNTGRDTIFRGIKRVLPGETLVVREGKIVESKIVTALPIEPIQNLSVEEAMQNLENALSDSVRVHLRSDVPYGLFLSGGLDSATILAMMDRHTDRPVRTYTIGFSGTEVHDERDQAQRLAKHFNTNHTELNFSEKDFWRLLPHVAASVDDPAVDAATLPTYMLAQEAKKELKVVLCGEGGDEVLAGYGRYRKVGLPKWLGGRIKRERGTFDKIKLKHPALNGWQEGLNAIEMHECTHKRTKLQLSQAIDCASWLSNGLLIKLDRCLMAHGLEGRTPFLDPVVAKALFSFPDHFKVRQGKGKWILRKWLEKELPESQPFAKKRGFTVPVGEWIVRKGARLAPLVARQPGIYELFEPEFIRDVFTKGDKHSNFAAWTLLFYALWHNANIMRNKPLDDVMATLANE